MSGAHRLDPTILREYDIRGIVGGGLDEAAMRTIGRAFASIMVRGGAKTAAVGYDGRLSSPALEAALVEGLCAAGLDVTRIGRGPSPMLYYAAHVLDADCGLMVTGSHNPPDFNGLKMLRRGASFFGADIQELGRVAAAGDFTSGAGRSRSLDVADDYVARLLADYRGKRPLRVAWDPGNGAAGQVLDRLVAGLPGGHIVINGAVDGTFPAHHPDPTVEANLDQLKAVVAAEGCDLGFAFDGDGDRIGLIDGRGRVLWGDQMMILLAREVLADLPGATIIADVKASRVFFDEVTRMGGNAVMWKTGHSLIKAKMAELGAPLAGEMSAHIFFKHRYLGFDDALYAAVRLLSIVASGGQSLADLLDALPKMVNTPELRFDCPEDRKFGAVEEVAARLRGRPGITVHAIDGVRVENPDGWWLLRASNTQAVLVARCESGSGAGLARLKAALAAELQAVGIAPPDGFDQP